MKSLVAGLLFLSALGAHAGESLVKAETLPGGAGIITFDLAKLADKRVLSAELCCERQPLTGKEDAARQEIEIFPLEKPYQAGGKVAAGATPLTLQAPWYDRFELTRFLRQVLAGRRPNGLYVKAFPGWSPEKTRLEVVLGGKTENLPPQPRALKVFHRAGQTFIVFEEIDDRSAENSPTFSALKSRLEKLDDERVVRYRVYRHSAPINAASLARAEFLGEVKPMSGYNVLGRSVDQLICQHRRRAMEDDDFAKVLARSDYFAPYNPDMPEMGEVNILRLAVEDGKPLPPRTGLYVHHPKKAGSAYYAVITSVNGLANAQDFSAANSLAVPVDESVGYGEPVLQGKTEVAVFFDYPGERWHYVQWAAPPLANLPNQYYNWGVFVPRSWEKSPVHRLSVVFHDTQQRYLKPPWPHRPDTVLLSPHDAPFRSYGYGYHEALGTLRSFRQGKVQPFFARRVDAMLEWAMKKFGAEAGRVSCGGHGTWGGTAALQYGLRRPGKIAYVMADGAADPDPAQTPYEYSYYPWHPEDRSQTYRPEMDAVWGKPEWKIPAESGKPIWEELSLPTYVRAVGKASALPYLSLGAGSMHVTWKQQTDLMKAYLETRNGLMAEFWYGGSGFIPLPVSVESGDHPFEPRSDRPLLFCLCRDYGPQPKFMEEYFETGKRGYEVGGRLMTQPRWMPEDMVDTPERLEVTIFSARNVAYAGGTSADVTIRNTRNFQPRAGERVTWSLRDLNNKDPIKTGEVTVGEEGLVSIPGLPFGEPARLVLELKGAAGWP